MRNAKPVYVNGSSYVAGPAPAAQSFLTQSMVGSDTTRMRSPTFVQNHMFFYPIHVLHLSTAAIPVVLLVAPAVGVEEEMLD